MFELKHRYETSTITNRQNNVICLILRSMYKIYAQPNNENGMEYIQIRVGQMHGDILKEDSGLDDLRLGAFLSSNL